MTLLTACLSGAARAWVAAVAGGARCRTARERRFGRLLLLLFGRLLLLLVVPRPAAAQAPAAPALTPPPGALSLVPTVALRFGQATERDGMPAAVVRSLLTDRAGFLWVGSQDGLARYDGRTFRVWRHRRGDSTALPHNIVISLAEDAAGRLWVGTHGGIGRFDAARQRFRTWHHRPADTLGLPADYDCRVWVGARSGTVWAGTDGGLYRYDPARDHWRRWPLPGMDTGRRLVYAGFEDRAGRFWCGNRGQVWVLDGRSGRVLATFRIPYKPAEPTPPVNAFYQQAGGRVWAATWGAGLVSLTDAGGHLLPAAVSHRWQPERVGIGETDIAYSLTETRDPATGAYALWAATDWGLLRMRTPPAGAPWPPALRAGRDYDAIGAQADGSAPTRPGGEALPPARPLLTDAVSQRLWVGTENGLRWHDAAPPLLTPVPLPPHEDAAPGCLVPDRDPRTGARQYWRGGWYGTGLQLLDSAFGLIRTWPRLPLDALSERAGQVSAVVRSRVDGAVWVATYGGLARLDPVSGQVRQYEHAATDTTSLPDSRTISLLEDRAGRLWVGTMQGVACLETAADRAAGRFRRSRFRRRVLRQAEDAAGRLWLGTDDGLWCLPAGPRGPARQYLPAAGNPRSLPGNHIRHLCPTPDGRVWVATRTGLGAWHPATDDFTQYHSGCGLPADDIYAARPDGAGRWWLLTPRGLVRATFPNGPFRVYGMSSGLPRTDLDGVLEPLPDGRLAVLVDDRLLLLAPAAARPTAHRPRVALTGVALFGQELLLTAPLDSGRQLAFGPDEHTLTFRFAALDFTDPAGNRCEYRLTTGGASPADSTWEVTADGAATFSHLPGGAYALHVRARNADGRRSVRTAVVPFRIALPFWQTGWFWGLLALAGTGALAGYGHWLRRAAAARARLTRELAELELRALRAQLNPHFIFNALNAVQELVLTGRATDAGRYLARFARLLRLVLDGADRPTIPLATELEMLELYVSIEQLRLTGLTVVFDIDPDVLAEAPDVPPMVLQPYLENAFWHGVAARPPHQRRVVVRLTFGPDETTLHAQVDDTGIGRAAAAAAQGTRTRPARGQHLTERRLTLLGATNPTAPTAAPVRITDLTDPVTGAAQGTRVELWLPLTPAG